jgi:hypothetical protein
VLKAFNSEYRLFIDFDNTISCGDVLDSVIETFAVGNRAQELEREWASGKIGAKECLDGQLRSIKATPKALTDHLATVTIDSGFSKILELTTEHKIETAILSDNFDLILSPILERLGLSHVPCYSNHLERNGDYFTPSFPYWNKDCPSCAHCKKTHFIPRNKDKRKVVYIGDGRSDICPSLNSDIVFAKDSLLSYLINTGVSCLPYHDLGQVAKLITTLIHDKHTTH